MKASGSEASFEDARKLKISVFGKPTITLGSGEVPNLSNQRARAILAMLCLNDGEAMDRETISRMLWPGRFPAQARASLRQCLLALSKLPPEGECSPLIKSTRSTIELSRTRIDADLFVLFDALSNRRGEEASRLIEDIGDRPLLDGFSFGASFAAWLTERRDAIEHRLDAEVRRVVSWLNSRDDPETAARLEAALQIRQREAYRKRGAGCRIAVLPFHQHDEIGGELFLSEGVVDELSSRLGNIQDITLAGRTSIAALLERGYTLQQMASELGVSHLIEGEVRRTHQGISVRIALIDGRYGTEIWSDFVSGSIEEFIGSRDMIGATVISAITRTLGLSAPPSTSRRMTTNRDAYALYLQGRALAQRVGVDGAMAKAIEFLEEALDTDPEFASCWTALADAHISVAALTPSVERVKNSRDAAQCAQCAISLDPGQGHAFSIMGIHEWTQFNPARALELSFEAFARDPNDADVISRLGSCLLYLGKTREGLPFIEQSVARDPIYGRNHVMLSSAYLSIGEVDKAIAAGRRMVDLGFPGMWLAVAYMAAGDHVAAVKAHYDSRIYLGTTIMRPPGMPVMDDAARDAYFDIAARGIFSGKAADRAVYCKMLDGLHATMADPYDSSIAFPAIWMGHADLVMKLYSECIHPANMFSLMSLWIDIDPINRTRLHPGFMQFAEKIGMVEAWEKFGWPDLIPHDPRNTSSDPD